MGDLRLSAWRTGFAVAALALVVMLAGPVGEVLAAPTGSIAGTVTDEATKAPIAGVPVCAVFDWVEEEWSCSESDALGSYEITGLAPREYTVEFTPGKVGLNYLFEAWDDKRTWVEGDPVTVEAGKVEGIDAELSEGGELRGRVINALTGAPVEGVEVCAEPDHWEVEEGCGRSGPDGEYTIYGLGTDEYWVFFFPPEELELLFQYWGGDPGFWSYGELVSVAVGSVTTGVDVSLMPGARISGTVTSAFDHSPVGGATPCAEIPENVEPGYSEGCATSDDAGHFTIRQLGAGEFNVRVYVESSIYTGGWYTGDLCRREPLTVRVAAGQEISGVDVELLRREEFPYCPVALEPQRPEPPLVEITRLRSRADGKVAVGLRMRRSGTLTFTARARLRRRGAQRHRPVTVLRKRVEVRAGHSSFKLTPNKLGRVFLRKRGRLPADLAIGFTTSFGKSTQLARSVIFKLGAGRRRANRPGHRRGRGCDLTCRVAAPPDQG